MARAGRGPLLLLGLGLCFPCLLPHEAYSAGGLSKHLLLVSGEMRADLSGSMAGGLSEGPVALQGPGQGVGLVGGNDTLTQAPQCGQEECRGGPEGAPVAATLPQPPWPSALVQIGAFAFMKPPSARDSFQQRVCPAVQRGQRNTGVGVSRCGSS